MWFEKHKPICEKIKNGLPVSVECTACGQNHNGEYGSRIFCNKKCARSYSTKANRTEINKKVSYKLSYASTGRLSKHYAERICEGCGNSFIINSVKRKDNRFCSTQCIHKSAAVLAILSQKATDRIKQGRAHPFGHKLQYEFNDKIIKCDSAVEYCCLDFIIDGYTVIDINRCNFSIPYELNGQVKNYIPDFIVQITGGTLLVECKSDKFPGNKETPIWLNYYSTVAIKQKILYDYCNSNNYIPMWFTQKVDQNAYYTVLSNIKQNKTNTKT